MYMAQPLVLLTRVSILYCRKFRVCSVTVITFVDCFKVLILEPNRVYLPSYAQVNEDGDEQVVLFFETSDNSDL